MPIDPMAEMNERLREVTEALGAPDREQLLLLDQFWDMKRLKVRPKLPVLLLEFAYADATGHDLFADDLYRGPKLVQVSVSNNLNALERKGYLVRHKDNDMVHLTAKGSEYVVKRHPTVLMYWERALQLSPPTITLLVSFIGLVASIFGIIQFWYWLKGQA